MILFLCVVISALCFIYFVEFFLTNEKSFILRGWMGRFGKISYILVFYFPRKIEKIMSSMNDTSNPLYYVQPA